MGHGGGGLRAGLDDHRSLFQPKQLCDVIPSGQEKAHLIQLAECKSMDGKLEML